MIDKVKWPLASFVVFFAIWEAGVFVGLIDGKLISPPSDIAVALVKMVKSFEIIVDIGASFKRYVIGFILGNLAGVVLGVVTGRVATAHKVVSPILNYLRSTPSVALVPAAIVWFGIGDSAKIFIVIWACTFPVWLNTYSGSREVEKEYIWAAQTLGARGWRMYWEVYLPRALPYIIAGSRVSVSTGWFGLAAAEMAGTYKGLAYRIFHSHEFFQVPEMFVGILMIGAVALTCDTAFVALMRRLIPWWRHGES